MLDNNIPIPTDLKLERSSRSSSSVSKGKSGEREALQQIVMCMQAVERELGVYENDPQSLKVQRNLQQSINGGSDLIGIPAIALEVKRQETLKIDEWWRQTLEQAAKLQAMPVLMYRQNRQKWNVRMMVHLRCPPYGDSSTWTPAEVSLTDFLAFYSEIYTNWLLTGRKI